MNRRQAITAGALAASSIASRSRRANAQDSAQVLRILGWPGYFESAITQGFSDQHNARVEITGIGTPDDAMLFLRAGGIGLYDLVVVTAGLVVPMGDAGLVQSIDPGLVPNLEALFPQFSAGSWNSTGDQRFGVPLVWGSLPLAYAPDGGPVPANWSELTGEAFKDSLVMPDDALGHFWIWNQALGADDPTKVPKEDLNRTTELLIDLKVTQARAFTPSVLAAMQSVARGEGSIATVGWQSAPLVTAAEERPLQTAHPAPGDASFCDNLAVVAESPHRELAHAFINYMISADPQRALIDRTSWATVNPHTVPLGDPTVSGLYDYENLDDWLSISPVRGYPPLSDAGDGIATYLDWVVSWDRVRSARG